MTRTRDHGREEPHSPGNQNPEAQALAALKAARTTRAEKNTERLEELRIVTAHLDDLLRSEGFTAELGGVEDAPPTLITVRSSSEQITLRYLARPVQSGWRLSHLGEYPRHLRGRFRAASDLPAAIILDVARTLQI